MTPCARWPSAEAAKLSRSPSQASLLDPQQIGELGLGAGNAVFDAAQRFGLAEAVGES